MHVSCGLSRNGYRSKNAHVQGRQGNMCARQSSRTLLRGSCSEDEHIAVWITNASLARAPGLIRGRERNHRSARRDLTMECVYVSHPEEGVRVSGTLWLV